jgi:hypothetical protein
LIFSNFSPRQSSKTVVTGGHAGVYYCKHAY